MNNLKTLQNTILIIAIIATPSLSIFGLQEGFESVKTFFLIIILLLATLFSKEKICLSNYKILLLLYLFINIVSSIFATDIYTAFFGYYNRFAGSILHIFALISFIFFYKKIKTNKLAKLVILSALTPTIYAYIQILNLDPIKWLNTERVFSTFGQPNLLGAYLAVVLTCVNLLAINTKKNKYLLLYLLIFIPFTQTFSLGSLITLALTYLLTFTHVKNIDIKKHIIIGFISIVVTILIGQHNIYRITKQIYAFNEDKTIITNDTAKIRLILWENTIDQALYDKKIFFLGVGPENYAYDFKRPIELNDTSEWKLLHTKPHNIYLEDFFETGIVGFTLLIAATIIILFKLRLNLYALIPLSILISSFFLWASSYLYFLFFLFCYSLFNKETSFRFNIKYLKLVNFAIIIISLIFVFSYASIEKNPCMSSKLINNYQPFKLQCAIKNNSYTELIQTYNINKKNRIISEKIAVALFFKNKDIALEIINNMLANNPKTPVYIFYKGQIEELRNNKEKAMKLYNEANTLVPNYFEANNAVIRLKN